MSSIEGQRGLDAYATGAWQIKVPLLGEVDNNMADRVRNAKSSTYQELGILLTSAPQWKQLSNNE